MPIAALVTPLFNFFVCIAADWDMFFTPSTLQVELLIIIASSSYVLARGSIKQN